MFIAYFIDPETIVQIQYLATLSDFACGREKKETVIKSKVYLGEISNIARSNYTPPVNIKFLFQRHTIQITSC